MVISKRVEAICDWLAIRFGILVVVCMYCRRLLGVKRAYSAHGGLSHGLCNPICEGAKANGWK